MLRKSCHTNLNRKTFTQELSYKSQQENIYARAVPYRYLPHKHYLDDVVNINQEICLPRKI